MGADEVTLVTVVVVVTITLAVEVFPVPPSVEVMVTLLFFMPAVVPWTFSEMVHEALAARVPEARLTEPEAAVAVAVPPQVLVNALGVATIRPAGNVSVKANSDSDEAALGLLMLKVSEVVPLSKMLLAPNDLRMLGGVEFTTLTLALEVFPVPPSVEVMVTLLFFMPVVVPWTFSETVHEALAARVPEARLTEPEAAIAVAEPPQVLVNALGVATTKPAGNVSVKANPVSEEAALGLVMLKVSEVVPLSVMLAAPKDLRILGGVEFTTLTLALEVFPAPPSVDVMLTLLFFVPSVVPWTFTATVQELLAASVPADRLTMPEAAVAVVVPPQVLDKPLGVATTRPAGKVSVNAKPVKLVPVLELVMVKVSEVVPLSVMVGAPKALVMLGAATTVRVAVLLPVPTVVWAVVMPEVVLGSAPAWVLVTLKITVQLLLAGMVMPVKLSAVAPAVKVPGVVPAQVPVTLPPAALIFTRVSPKDAPVSAVEALPLAKVTVTTEVPPD